MNVIERKRWLSEVTLSFSSLFRQERDDYNGFNCIQLYHSKIRVYQQMSTHSRGDIQAYCRTLQCKSYLLIGFVSLADAYILHLQ